MITGSYIKALPGWIMWAALAGLVAAAAGWGYLRGLHSERAERDRIVADYAEFRAQVAALGHAKQAEATAETHRLEKLNEDTHTAYGVALGSLNTRLLADRVRRPAGPACPGGGGVPEAPAATAGADAAATDAGSDRHEPAAKEPTLAERCARTTLQCAYLQDWAERSADAGW